MLCCLFMVMLCHKFKVTSGKKIISVTEPLRCIFQGEKFSDTLFNARVTPWIHQPTLNVKMTSWRGFKRIYLSHIHIVQIWKRNVWTSTIINLHLPVFHDDTSFSNVWIFTNFIKCTLISTDLCGWNKFLPGEKVSECPYCAQHNTVTVVTGNASQIKGYHSEAYCVVPDRTVPLSGNEA